MMETCQYEPVNTNIENSAVTIKWRPFLRQFLVSSSIWISFFIMGLCNGAPTVFIPQLRREANSTAAVSNEMASWMSSIHGYAGIPWVIILPMVTERFGRKLPFLFVNVCVLCSFIFFYCSSNITHILIGEVMQGTIAACIVTINLLIVTEYSSPRYRGIFLGLKSATFTWGLWCANAMGTFFHWKQIAIVGILSASYCIVNTIFWPESPYWLAAKGYYEKCAESHHWLKGSDEDSEKEQEALIESKKLHLISESNQTKNRFKVTVLSKAFCKPISICLLTLSLFHVSGKMVCAVYSIDIIKKITNNESTAYTGMLILDGVTVLGMYIGCALFKIMKRRTMLLTGSSIAISLLFIMSLYLYLIKLSVITENKFLSLSFLAMFSLTICCGPMLMSTTIYCELVPLRFRSFSILVVGLYHNILLATMLKIFPTLFKYFKLHGAFLFYGIMSTICIILLYIYLPETKDKTLQEIEDCLRNPSMIEMKEHNVNDDCGSETLKKQIK